MKTSELFAALENGFVLEWRSKYASCDSQFMGLYYVAPSEYQGTVIKGYYERFGWGSALGVTNDALMLLISNPEMFRCASKTPEEYGRMG